MATSKFLRTFRTTTGAPITAATIWLVPQSDTYPTNALALTAHATRDGQYYRDNVPDGEYKVYIDPAGGSSPTLYDEHIWLGEQRVTTISDHFDAADGYKLKINAVQDLPFVVGERTFLKPIASGDRNKVIPEAFSNFRFTEDTDIDSLRVAGVYKQLYLFWIFNTNTVNAIYIANSVGTIMCGHYVESTYKTGIEEVALIESGSSGIAMTVVVDWDLLRDAVIVNTTEIELDTELIAANSIKLLDTRLDKAEYQKFPFSQDTFRSLAMDNAIDIRSLEIFFVSRDDAYDANGKLKEIHIGSFVNNASYSIVELYVGATLICHYDGAPLRTGISKITLAEYGGSNIYATMTINWDATGLTFYPPTAIQGKIRDSILIEGLMKPLLNSVPVPFAESVAYNDLVHPLLRFTKFDFLFPNPADRFNADGTKKQFYFTLIQNNSSPDRLIVMINEVGDTSIINGTFYSYIIPHPTSGLANLTLLPENRPYYINLTIDIDLLGVASTFNFNSTTGLISDEVVDKGYELSKYLSIENITSNKFPNALNKAPNFKAKLTAQTDDVLVLFLGDSLFATADTLMQNNYDPNADKLPPHCTAKNVFYNTWNNVVIKNRPNYDRYDSTDNAFTETVGSWATANDLWQTPDWTAEYRGAGSLTRWTNTANASFNFDWDLDSYEKLNLITRKDIYGTAAATINVGGTGDVEIQDTDGSWVEANGYAMNLYIDPAVATDGSGYCQSLGNWRYKMRRASTSGGGIITVTVTKPNNSDRLFYWGTERYNGAAILFTNVARGGRAFTHFLKVYLNDIYLRKPDLILFELPITNECFGNASVTAQEHIVYEQMQDLIWGDRVGNLNSNSFKEISNNWTDFEVVAILPNLASSWIDPTTGALLPLSVNTKATELDIMNRAKNLILSKGDIEFIDYGNVFIQEGRKRNRSFYDIHHGNENVFDYMYNLTYDSVHPNTLGARLWGEYLASLFLDII